jgi:hypothetical protein
MKTYKKIFCLCVALGLICSLILNYQRMQVEDANKQIETVMESEAMYRIAQEDGVPVQDVYKAFRDIGVTTMSVSDESLLQMSARGRIVMYTGEQLLHQYRASGLTAAWQAVVDSPDFSVNALYLTDGRSPRALDETVEALKMRFGEQRLHQLSTQPRIYSIDAVTETNNNPFSTDMLAMQQMPLTILTERIEEIKNAGFYVCVRPVDYVEWPYEGSPSAEEIVRAFFNHIDKSGAEISLLIPAGKTMLGYPDVEPVVAEEMRKRNITLGMVENDIQLQFVKMKGLTDMAPLMDYQVARTYVITVDEQRKMSIYDAFRRWPLSDSERNIRVHLIRTFLTPREGKTLLKTNLDYVQKINDFVASKGYTSGRADIYKVYWPSRLYYVPMAFSLAAAWCLYVLQLGFLKEKYYGRAVAVLGILIAGALCLTGSHSLVFRQAAALGAAVIFPVLAVQWMMGVWENGKRGGSMPALLGRTVVYLFLAMLFSLVGASFLGAVLSDTRFLLELDIYRGVKLTFMLPALLVLLHCIVHNGLWHPGEGPMVVVRRIRSFMNHPLTFNVLAILAVAAVVLWVFIGRSGHTAGVPVPAIETKMRYFLEEAMYARPREKEFLIGHPAFFLAAWAYWRKLPVWFCELFVVAATIGQGSLVQTFAHMRTPIFMSYVRALDGYALGIVGGIIAVLIFEAVYRFASRHISGGRDIE